MKKSRRGRRRSFSSRNPARRSRMRRRFSFRNPGGPIQEIFNAENLTIAGGAVVGNIGTAYLLNKLLLPGADGKIPLALPGVDTTKQGYMQSMPVALYKVLIGAGAGYLLRNRAPKLATGFIIGSLIGGMNTLVAQSNVLASLPGGSAATAGTGRYFNNGRGTGGYLPGVPAEFTGPAGAFLHRQGSPMNNGRGTGTMITPKFARQAGSMVANPFKS